MVYSGDLYNSFNEAGNLEVRNLKQTTAEVLNTINTVSSGKLPFELKFLEMRKLSPSLNENYKQNIIIFVLVFLVVSLTYIFFTYKFMGVVASVCILGQVGFVIASLTGFFSFLPGVFVNMSAAIGGISSIVFGVCVFVFLASRILKKLNNINNLELAINRTFRETSNLIVISNLLIILINLILMSIFVAEKNDLFSKLLSPINSLLSIGAQHKVFSFSYAMFMGTVGCLIFQYFVAKLLLKSMPSFKYFRNSKIYGGKVR